MLKTGPSMLRNKIGPVFNNFLVMFLLYLFVFLKSSSFCRENEIFKNKKPKHGPVLTQKRANIGPLFKSTSYIYIYTQCPVARLVFSMFIIFYGTKCQKMPSQQMFVSIPLCFLALLTTARFQGFMGSDFDSRSCFHGQVRRREVGRRELREGQFRRGQVREDKLKAEKLGE